MNLALGKFTKIGLIGGLVVGLIYFYTIIFLPLPRNDFFVSGNKQTGMGCADFVVFFAAATLSTSPDRFNVYDVTTQLRTENALIAPSTMAQPFYIQYPPWLFPLLAPLSFLGIKPAFVLWSLFWPTAAALSLSLLLTTTAFKSKLDRALIVLLMLDAAPTVIGIKTGQSSLWFFAGACLFWYAWRTERIKQIGLWVAASTIKLQYSLFLVIPIVAQRKWRALAWLILFQSVLVAAACMDVGWQSFVKYPQFLWTVETSGESVVGPESMANLGAIFLRFLPKKVALIFSLGAFALSLLYLVSVWYRSGKLTQKRDSWPIAVTCALALVANPHTHFHMCVLFAIAAAVTLKTISLTGNAADPSVPYRSWALLITYYPLLTWICFMYGWELPIPIFPMINLGLAILAIVNTEIDLKLKT